MLCVTSKIHPHNTVLVIWKLSILPQLNNLEKAVSAAHTFLKKNPTDSYLKKNMKYYQTLMEVEEYLIDHEEQPYEVRTLQRCRSYPECKPNTCSPTSTCVIASLCNPECFSEEREALQQRRLQQQRPQHGAGHHTILWRTPALLGRLRGLVWDLRVQRLLSHLGR